MTAFPDLPVARTPEGSPGAFPPAAGGEGEVFSLPDAPAQNGGPGETPFPAPGGGTFEGGGAAAFLDDEVPLPSETEGYFPGEGPLPGEGDLESQSEAEGVNDGALFPGEGGGALSAEDARLLADPDRGETYRALRPAVLATVAYSRRTGSPVGVEDAFRAALAEAFFPMVRAQRETAEADARQRAANRAATPGPLSGPAAAPGADYAAMSGEDFGRLVQRALRGELRRG